MMQFDFVSVTGSGGATDPAHRRIVRSRCMRGINSRRISRRSLQAERKKNKAKTGNQSSVISEDKSQKSRNESLNDNVVANRSMCTTTGFFEDHLISKLTKIAGLRQQAIEAFNIAIHNRDGLSSPPRTISDRWLVKLACCEDVSSRELLFKYGWFKSRLYPVDHCVDFVLVDSRWADYLAFDEGFVHSTLFAASAMEDFVLQRPLSHITRLHFHHTVQSLQKALQGGDGHITETTLYIILSLCIIACIYADGDALITHLAGLRYLAAIRPRIGELLLHPLMSFKMEELDLAAYLCTGLQLRPIMGPLPRALVAPARTPKTIVRTHITSHIHDLIKDNRLLLILSDIRHLSDQMDQSFSSGTRLPGTDFRKSIQSIHLRLLQLNNEPSDTREEALRLGLMAFLSSNLRVASRRIHYAYLRSQIREVCISYQPNDNAERGLKLWLLMMSAISVFEPEDSWIRGQWKQTLSCDFIGWDTLRDILCQIIWTTCLHEELGREALGLLQVE